MVAHKKSTYAAGQERKDDGKPGVTSVATTICFNISFKLHHPLNRSFCKRPENINLSEDHDKTLYCRVNSLILRLN